MKVSTKTNAVSPTTPDFALAQGDSLCPGQGKLILFRDNINIYARIHDSDPHNETSCRIGIKDT